MDSKVSWRDVLKRSLSEPVAWELWVDGERQSVVDDADVARRWRCNNTTPHHRYESRALVYAAPVPVQDEGPTVVPVDRSDRIDDATAEDFAKEVYWLVREDARVIGRAIVRAALIIGACIIVGGVLCGYGW